MARNILIQNNTKRGPVSSICTLILPILLLLLSACSQEERPNILLIYSDDQGSIDLNCYGATDLKTPNLDLLASNGIRFTQFYAGSSVCSPSRAALLTGMSPHAAGLPGNTSSQPGHPGMPGDRVTIAELMKEAGYATAHIGKWHLGYSEDTRPLAQGFDYSFGHMGGCIDNYSHFFYWNGPNQHDLWEDSTEIFRPGEYFPDMMVEQAVQFFKEHKSEPFFMYFAINLPHYPLQPTQKWRDYYQHLEMPRRDYAAFVSVVDERVGELVQSLEQLGIRDQTIIIFQSDQGHSCETRTFGGGWNSGPYRGAKASLFEGGIRVPAILNWPGELPAGQVNPTACINYDWYATIADICGIEELPSAVEGKSLLPIIEEPMTENDRVFYWKLGRQWAVRSWSWKLLGNPTDPSKKYPIDGTNDQLFLVNLDQDPGEQFNQARKYPEKLDELLQGYLQWEFATASDIPDQLPPFENLAKEQTISLSAKPDQKYRAQGPETLINGKRGSGNFDDGEWLGFQGTDLECQIDIGGAKKVRSVIVRTMQSPDSWIFQPKAVQVQGGLHSGKEINFGQIISADEEFHQEFLVKEFEFRVDQTKQFLNIKLEAQ